MSLEIYQRKRDFTQTPEPKGKIARRNLHRFVVQEHHASKLHFDFRLEMGGVLKSWSIPKGPSLDPADKRFAVPTEDHPVEYLKFQGHIPAGNYGAGEHMIWDAGTYELLRGDDPLAQLAEGKLNFTLKGEKLRGAFNLFRLGHNDKRWLLIKSRDEFAEAGWQLKLLLETDETTESAKVEHARKRRERAEVKKYSTKPSDGGRVVAASRAFQSGELSGDMNVKVGREIVHLTNLGKPYWPDEGYTKADLLKYYYEISPYILPYLKDRPLIMKRYPDGIEGKSFHQHDVRETPDFVRTAALDVEEGHVVDYIVGDNAPTMLYMANLGAIERHPWHSRLKNLQHPDWVVLDLDPEEVEFSEICEVALSARRILEELGLESYAKTSGSRGMHIYVPLKPAHAYEPVAEFAELLAARIVEAHPGIATVERSLRKRQRRRIYIDHMQNARGKSVVAPYSVRPRPAAPVSAPLTWDEVSTKKITPQDFHIKNILPRIAQIGDLFRPVLNSKQTLQHALDKLHGEPATRKPQRTKA
jgi:bifunctional non-homologous end joining protein LigD